MAMTADAVFDLASVTKVAATTMALMVLVDDGAVSLDDPVSLYLPDFAGAGKEAITLQHLLTHTSGLAQWEPVYYYASTPQEAYERIRDRPLEWSVGAERHYSDLGFMLLGRVVEVISGSSVDDFTQRELYRPLGLERIGFVPSDGSPAGPYAATSYGNPFEHRMVADSDFGYSIDIDPNLWSEWREGWLSGEVNDGNAHHAFGGIAGHAGLFATADDLAALVEAVMLQGRPNSAPLVAPEVVTHFTTEVVDGQALGWQVPSYAPPGSFGHSGFTGTFVLVVPSSEMVVVLLTNRQNFGVNEETQYPDVGPLQRAVTAILTGGER